jgi:hypothetical protein
MLFVIYVKIMLNLQFVLLIIRSQVGYYYICVTNSWYLQQPNEDKLIFLNKN